jgi:NAD(P)-dependent dehydrogenase (short-subunit alcohol dehydrogenase family)
MRLLRTLALAGLAVAAIRTMRAASPYNFAGKVALITGGSRGLGLAIARRLADEGARLALMARDPAELERAAADLRSRGAQVLTLAADVGDQRAASAAVQRTAEHYGALDVLINNAGIIQVGPLDNTSVEEFRQAMDVHMWGPLYTTLAARPHMRGRGGRIVNIASIGGLVSVPHLVPYTASKHALVGLSDGLRAELASEGIVVTTVCPGLMRTGSHFNALFTGRHEQELAWFTTIGTLPLLTVAAEHAARAVVEASRAGRPSLTIGWQARGLRLFDTLLPNLNARIMMLTQRLLPAPEPGQLHDAQSGWQSRSSAVPGSAEQATLADAVRLNGLRGQSAAGAGLEAAQGSASSPQASRLA